MPDTIESTLLVNRQHMPYETDGGIARRAAIGLVVLATDNTIEYEWRQMLGLDGVAFYETRIPNSPDINAETLAAMEGDLKSAAAIIRPGEHLDVVAFGCTSGAMVIGPDVVAQRFQEARPGVKVTTPVTAALAGLEALGAKRIALLTPYIDSINQMMRRWFMERGVAVPVMGSFNQGDDHVVAKITPAALEAAAVELGQSPHVDAVFVSCTSLRVAEIVERVEAKIGKPVSGSNHAMAWHALRLAGYTDAVPGFGRLLRV